MVSIKNYFRHVIDNGKLNAYFVFTKGISGPLLHVYFQIETEVEKTINYIKNEIDKSVRCFVI